MEKGKEATITHYIRGYFWEGEKEKDNLSLFKGEIDVSSDGIFTGYVKDEYGRADVRGKIRDEDMIFYETYKERKKTEAAEGTIRFCFTANPTVFIYHVELVEKSRSDLVTAGEVTFNPGNCGGMFYCSWKGFYDVVSSSHKGNALCVIYPM